MNTDQSYWDTLLEGVKALADQFSDLPSLPKVSLGDRERAILLEVATRMGDNYPYFHPFYAGQMLKPPHPLAQAAYMLAMYINPNNHALDGGRASSAMEKEAVAQLAELFGFKKHLGHLTGGGTMANLEALWVAREIHPDKKIAASELAHYTHSRLTGLLKIPFVSIPVDCQGKMDVQVLAEELEKGEIGTVVATAGVTGVGSVDPIDRILSLRQHYDFRLHVDGAYGAYFTLADNLEPAAMEALDRLGTADSLVVDPHKHGLQPYGCGCVLFRDPTVGRYYNHDSPYTYFTSDELHLGEISLECSRPGAAAVALWATQKLMPLEVGGEFARGLEKCREGAIRLHRWLAHHPRFLTTVYPQLDIVLWSLAGERAGEISRANQAFFEKASAADLHLSVLRYPSRLVKPFWPEVEFDVDEVVLIRSCLMKPSHLDWLDRIKETLEMVLDDMPEMPSTSTERSDR